MRLNAAIDTSTALGAQQALQQLADHYTATGDKGRLAFSRDNNGDLTGADRSRGMMANVKSIAVGDFKTDAKAEFDSLIRTAYPAHADAILNFIDARQQGGVTKMVTPGMVKEAYAKAQELVTGWRPDASSADLVAHPNGDDPTRHDLAAAIGLIKDGVKPTVNGGDVGETAQNKFFAQQQLEHPNQFTACHDTAIQLQDLMGKPNNATHAGGKGPVNRNAASQAAINAINNGPCIIQIKGTATADGHSFSLVCKPNGKVDVLEAWASGHNEADLGRLLGQCKKDLSKADVIAALQKIVSNDPNERTQGYTALSTAYNDSARYELKKDPQQGETLASCRDTDANISLEVNIRELRPQQEIQDRISARLNLVSQYKQDVSLTNHEKQVLRQNGANVDGTW